MPNTQNIYEHLQFESELYSIIKDYGLCTIKQEDGSYEDETQAVIDAYEAGKVKNIKAI